MIDELMNVEPFSLLKTDKERILARALLDLTAFHYDNCREYRSMLDALGFDPRGATGGCRDLPFLPVRLFKELTLKSVSDAEIFKTMTSSGTTGQATSRIFLDRATAGQQQKALVRIVASFLGTARLPMIIIDCPSSVRDRRMFSARGAAILGFSIFGNDKIYALDDDMNLDVKALAAFLAKHSGKRILLFGFTFMVWQHFCAKLKNLSGMADLSGGVLIHGGGWKKLAGQSVSPGVFKSELKAVCGIDHVHNYYGMVEQTGCVYMECEKGHLHASVFSDVITRRADLSVCDYGEAGIIEVVSALPKSYCGHVLLTEDEGVILGEDDCPCGRKGKYFKVLGRLKDAEIRGCSDAYAASF
ncbi:MAG: hypothetical protein LBO03_08050 [Acidaminococcales bacterium]|nr:hypothetical protein [Acidaminococcales bacterium]